MKKRLSLQLMAAILAACAPAAFAQHGNIGIKVTATFDYPGAAATLPQKINDHGEIVGVYMDNNGFTYGFERMADGTFIQIVDPNDQANFTEGRGINDSGLICGDYEDASLVVHGFFFDNGTYTNYDVPKATTTTVLGLNNAGDFCGGYTDSKSVPHGYLNIAGKLTTITISGALISPTYQLTDTDAFVGYYLDSGSVSHGYYGANPQGALQAPIDPDGSTATVLFGINGPNIVGRYVSSDGNTHGLLLKAAARAQSFFFTFDYPGSTFTSLNGINGKGHIVGRYVDPNTGIAHGFVGGLTSAEDPGAFPLREVPAAAATESHGKAVPAQTRPIVPEL